MESPADVLIVARPEDSVAGRVRQMIEKTGRTVIYLDGPAASRLFTIRVDRNATSVEPAVPMFVRSSAWWDYNPSLDPDDLFVKSEEYATFWAVAALAARPVINRPKRTGQIGRMTWGPISRTLNFQIQREWSESYASGPEMIPEARDVWGEDPNFVSGSIQDLRKRVPIRARRINVDALYEIVTIVGDKAFPATNDPRTVELDLASKSLALARLVDIQFATITWAVDNTEAIPVRLNADPDETELRYNWNEIAEALCEQLLPCS